MIGRDEMLHKLNELADMYHPDSKVNWAEIAMESINEILEAEADDSIRFWVG